LQNVTRSGADAIHPFLVFRGQDIQDLHVHEDDEGDTAKPAAPAPAPVAPSAAAPPPAAAAKSTPKPESKPKTTQPPKQQPKKSKPPQESKESKPKSQQPRRKNTRSQVGTGASLLNRSERGVVANHPSGETKADFDFTTATLEEDEEVVEKVQAYAKDDFFDSISCEALDKQAGSHTRLRGSAERKLNTEAFGAVALNQRRGGRGRGGRGGRGRGGRRAARASS